MGQHAIDRVESRDAERPVEACSAALRAFLLEASRPEEKRIASGVKEAFFAFKLHQFLAGAGRAYTTLDPPGSRRVVMDGQVFDPADGNVHLCYVGTLLPAGIETLRLLLRGFERARRDDPAAARLRLHFFGTSNQTAPDARPRVLPVARELGVSDRVRQRGRVGNGQLPVDGG